MSCLSYFLHRRKGSITAFWVGMHLAYMHGCFDRRPNAQQLDIFLRPIATVL